VVFHGDHPDLHGSSRRKYSMSTEELSCIAQVWSCPCEPETFFYPL
jgi:hypothetical protein